MGLVFAILMSAAVVTAAKAPLCVGEPAAGHASVTALPDAYWRAVPVWADLTVQERDLLARVSIAQRNRRSNQNRAIFRSETPKDIVDVPGHPGTQFAAEGVAPLLKMVEDARAHLAKVDPKGEIALGSGYRAYEEQLKQWPLKLKIYFLRHKQALAAHFKNGSYTDDAVCALRETASPLYAFPGYSNHQSGRAIDFRTRVGAKGPLLVANTKEDAKRAWCQTPLYLWLIVHAREYGFVQDDIDEPWHWEFDPAAARDPKRTGFIAPSCRMDAQPRPR